MEPLFRDTDPKAEAILLSLLRKADAAKKFSTVRSLSRMVMQLSRRAIERANPELGEKEIDLLFISHHYGKELADRVKSYRQAHAGL